MEYLTAEEIAGRHVLFEMPDEYRIFDAPENVSATFISGRTYKMTKIVDGWTFGVTGGTHYQAGILGNKRVFCRGMILTDKQFVELTDMIAKAIGKSNDAVNYLKENVLPEKTEDDEWKHKIKEHLTAINEIAKKHNIDANTSDFTDYKEIEQQISKWIASFTYDKLLKNSL